MTDSGSVCGLICLTLASVDFALLTLALAWAAAQMDVCEM